MRTTRTEIAGAHRSGNARGHVVERYRVLEIKRILGCALLAAAIGCGGGGGDGDSDGPPEPAECLDVAGEWFVSESARLDCDDNLDPFVPGTVSGSGDVTIDQQGCRVSYRVPQLDVQRRGIVGPDFIELSGPLALVEGVRVIDNFLDVSGPIDPTDPSAFTVSGAGRLTLEFEGERGSCSVTSTATFRR